MLHDRQLLREGRLQKKKKMAATCAARPPTPKRGKTAEEEEDGRQRVLHDRQLLRDGRLQKNMAGNVCCTNANSYETEDCRRRWPATCAARTPTPKRDGRLQKKKKMGRQRVLHERQLLREMEDCRRRRRWAGNVCCTNANS